MDLAPDFTAWSRLRTFPLEGYHSAIVKKGCHRSGCVVRIRSFIGRKVSVNIHFLDRVESHVYDLDDLKF